MTAARRVRFFAPPQRPTGGGTVYVRPKPQAGNPYARIDEVPARPVVVVDLPDFPQEEK